MGVDEAPIELTRVHDGPLNGCSRDLVEHHAPNVDLGSRVEDLQEVPGDRLPFAVFIGGEEELVDFRQLRLQILDDVLLVP